MASSTFAPESASQTATTPSSAPFESWGRYPVYQANVVPLHWQSDFPAVTNGLHNGSLVVGMGRSYGDSCLLKDGNLLVTTAMNRLISFDPETGLLTAEAGLTLAQILDFAVPRGFFLPVTPGTKYVTLGGAIANDIHGKNHHVAGCFGNHIVEFELVRSDGSRRLCSRTENLDWFAATIGGLGLTGMITWATLRLRPIVSRGIDYEGIQFHGIDEFLALTEASKHIEYTVSWIDCASTGKNFMRGVFMQGDHSQVPAELKPSPEPKLVFPFEAPGFCLNHTTVSAFNTVFFHKQMKPASRRCRTTSRSSIRWTRCCTGTACTARAACCSSSTRSRGSRRVRGRLLFCARWRSPGWRASWPC
ncbi:FAD-binding oxidoreductase [Granulicella sp. WH15]|uniref:FAD-binding oxidoreductase n=1 Tax=Granulicella sp. WH15 TaxID=2602070 RepID=UPI0031F6C145